ncbi:MAG TPA: hypothetical protein VGV10_05125 [Thermoleophilaceae bacterium]|nr:hypothetical protein [Thermoleophilaceae bacterium]
MNRLSGTDAKRSASLPNPSDAHRFRKVVAGFCMIVAPLLLLLSMIVESRIGAGEDSFVIGRVGDPDTGSLEQMLLVAGLVLMVPAMLGLMHMLRERDVAFGHVGGAVALFGLLVMPYALMACLVILAVGLYRARAVQSVTALLIAIAAALLAAGAGFESEMLGILGSAVMLVGLGGGGWTVLRQSDEDWEHTPEHKGFRPLAGM